MLKVHWKYGFLHYRVEKVVRLGCGLMMYNLDDMGATLVREPLPQRINGESRKKQARDAGGSPRSVSRYGGKNAGKRESRDKAAKRRKQ
jgi:hypothetical protein